MQLFSPAPAERRQRQKKRENARLRNRRSMRGREAGENLLVIGADQPCFTGVGGVEVGSQIDEVADGDGVVVIQIALLPGNIWAGLVEVAGKIDEVRDGDDPIEIKIADAS